MMNKSEIQNLLDRQTGELYLCFPSLEFEEQILSYREEFLAQGETMAGTSGLRLAKSVEEWIADLDEQLLGSSDEFVQASTYLCIRRSDQRLLGMINIRHHLNDYLRSYGGHIGYSIRYSERNKGYGRTQLALALDICRHLGLTRLLLTCDKENPASAAVIRANGGILVREKAEEHKVMQHYWLYLTNSV